MRKILFVVMTVAFFVIAWLIGLISLPRLGAIMAALIVLGLIFTVLALLGVRVPLGDVSNWLPVGRLNGSIFPRRNRN